MKNLFFIIILCLGLQSYQSYGQALMPFEKYVKGIVVDDSTGQRVPFTNLYNESQRIGAISDDNGSYKIIAKEGDTLVLSAIGYLSKVAVVPDNLASDKFEISLEPRKYEIDEVSITSFRDYEHFKEAFLALELPETPTKKLRNDLVYSSRVAAADGAANSGKADKDMRDLQPNIRLVQGVPIQYEEDKQRINFQKVLKQEARQRIIDEKFNKDVIRHVTHIPEDEIIDFMGFCDFKEQFLLEATPYEIVEKIAEKYEEYKRSKDSGALFDMIDGSRDFNLS